MKLVSACVVLTKWLARRSPWLRWTAAALTTFVLTIASFGSSSSGASNESITDLIPYQQIVRASHNALRGGTYPTFSTMNQSINLTALAVQWLIARCREKFDQGRSDDGWSDFLALGRIAEHAAQVPSLPMHVARMDCWNAPSDEEPNMAVRAKVSFLWTNRESRSSDVGICCGIDAP